MSIRRLVAGLLFILTAILHFVQPFVYGIIFSTIGYTVFGFIYLSLGILQFSNKPWTLKLSIILPSIGLLASLVDYFTSPIRVPIYPLLAAIDVVIIILCVIEFYSINKTKK